MTAANAASGQGRTLACRSPGGVVRGGDISGRGDRKLLESRGDGRGLSQGSWSHDSMLWAPWQMTPAVQTAAGWLVLLAASFRTRERVHKLRPSLTWKHLAGLGSLSGGPQSGGSAFPKPASCPDGASPGALTSRSHFLLSHAPFLRCNREQCAFQ